MLAVAIGTVSYLFLEPDILLAGWTAVVWFVAVRSLSIPLRDGRNASLRRGGIAAGIMAALAVGPALLGVSPFLSISPELRLALLLLVIGTGVACGSVSSLLALRRSEEKDQFTTDQTAGKPGNAS